MLAESRPRELEEAFAGLDALDLGVNVGESRARRLWRSTWPKVAALALALGIWQAVVWSGWKSRFVLAPPYDSDPNKNGALEDLWDAVADGTIFEAVGITLRRAAVGFLLAMVIGVVVGSVVSRVRPARAAFGSLITGLQTMPSIAWFPLAILLFKISEEAILFVVVLGAAPAIANGLITGTDHIPPLLLRAGRVLGARRWAAYRHIILPASLPSFVGGLKQGWAFAWRSLMAGELIVIIPNAASIGYLLQTNRDLANSSGLLATMLVILVIGMVVDFAVFGTLDRVIRRRWGLLDRAG